QGRRGAARHLERCPERVDRRPVCHDPGRGPGGCLPGCGGHRPDQRGDPHHARHRGERSARRSGGCHMSTTTSDSGMRAQTPDPIHSRSLGRYLLMPALLALVLLALYWYVTSQELDSIETRTLNAPRLAAAAIEHVQLTVASTALTLVIALPLG